MLERCYNKQDIGYQNYGGRGIKVCDIWKESFFNFLEDMGERPSTDYSLDRMDNDGNYDPSNCKWSTIEEQANNRRNNIIVTIDGVTKSITQWCDELNLNRFTIYGRISKHGFTPEEALTTPIKQEQTIEFDGVTRTIIEWSKVTGIAVVAIRKRLHNNWPIEQVLTTPNKKRVRYIEIDGISKTLKEWCEQLKLNVHTVKGRLRRGMEVEKAFELG